MPSCTSCSTSISRISSQLVIQSLPLTLYRYLQHNNTRGNYLKSDPHLEELTISIAMDNRELLITNVYIPPAITRPVLEYASTIWSPNASESNIDKLQIVQNTALRIATGCTHDTNTQHLHDETNVLPIHQHLQLRASQIRQTAQHPTHPLYKQTIHSHTPRLKKQTTSTTPPT